MGMSRCSQHSANHCAPSANRAAATHTNVNEPHIRQSVLASSFSAAKCIAESMSDAHLDSVASHCDCRFVSNPARPSSHSAAKCSMCRRLAMAADSSSAC